MLHSTYCEILCTLNHQLNAKSCTGQVVPLYHHVDDLAHAFVASGELWSPSHVPQPPLTAQVLLPSTVHWLLTSSRHPWYILVA
jgi:hypothetical protein